MATNLDDSDKMAAMKGLADTVSRLSEDVRELSDAVSQQLASTKSDSSSIKEAVESLAEQTTVVVEAMSYFKSELASLSGETVLNRGGGGETSGKESGSLRKTIESGNDALRKQLLSLEASVDLLRAMVTSKDSALKRMEAIVASLEEMKTPAVDCPKETIAEVPEEAKHVEGPETSTPEAPEDSGLLDEERRNYIDDLMRKTEILEEDEDKSAHVRSLYERLYSISHTKYLLVFLLDQPRLKIVVDCDSETIGRMVPEFRDPDGVLRNGATQPGHADFENQKAYFGGRVRGGKGVRVTATMMAVTLAQMAMHLRFRNGGRPYEEGDVDRGNRFKGIVQEESQKLVEKGDDGLEFAWQYALLANTQLGKEINLISSVPAVLAMKGMEEGTSSLRKHAPSLLDYYEREVLLRLVPY